MNTELLNRYQQVLTRIETARTQCGRDDSVTLLAVSKTKPLADIEALADAGQKAFGENYVQEALDKIVQRPDLEWHFIGPIQSNKTKPIAEHFQWVHSVDRLKIAKRLSAQRPPGLGDLQILLEVNVSDEASKSGFRPNEILDVAEEVMALPNLALRGLMAIPARAESLEAQRQPFRQLRELLTEMQKRFPQASLDTLSMGMSADLEAAIMEGSTLVRIGTDIFGARHYA
ncbi:YggS family pyridoxal phosphate enzyme [Thiomicrospira sp. XS5]|uniref:YggS family pyridoxal phosphate-dependent enzyme n=1 Tax=Thiomicrospira sp. XS5 TaxID=1775636 RepID=UPI000746C0F1|nr:YggS family pyridoxal phosphate-dependent enzyme [Thiomicrospira sp. XS5]KUJ76103.1 YggS family pyridoxal phosphate enzyme [Thiomicrospira sp. XS5]